MHAFYNLIAFIILTMYSGQMVIAQKYLEKGNKYFNRNMFQEAITNY